MTTSIRCTKCALHKSCKNVKIDKLGTGKILVIGGSPSRDEDRSGQIFSSRDNLTLLKLLEELDIQAEDYSFTNAVKCFSEKTPGIKMIRECSEYLLEEIAELQPEYVVPLGSVAIKALQELKILKARGSVTQLHGSIIRCDNFTILPMVSPSYVLRDGAKNIQMYVESLNQLEQIVVQGLPDIRQTNYTFVNKISELEDVLREAVQHEFVAYDIETSTLHPREDLAKEYVCPKSRIVSFSLSWEPGQAAVFYLEPANYDKALYILHKELLENEKITKVIHHAKFELLWSMAHGYTIKNMQDTMLMHWHLDERKGVHSLSKLTMLYTDLGFYDTDLENYIKNNPEANPDKLTEIEKQDGTTELHKGSYANVPFEILLPYNAADTDACLRIHEILLEKLSSKQKKIHDEIQIPSCYPLAAMELGGISIDWEYLYDCKEKLESKITEIELALQREPDIQLFNKMRADAGREPINYNSSVQLQELLYDICNLKPLYRTAARAASVDKNCLEYCARTHNVPKLILQRRDLHTELKTFIKGPVKRRYGDKVHTSYGMVHTETGRLNSANPNLQNIKNATHIKNLYIPDENEFMVQFDYSQVELRVLALFSGDENLLNYFREGHDVHRMVASRVHNCDPDEITKQQRTAAKRIVFGLCYGQGVRGLAEELEIYEEEAEAFLNKFFQEFPSVKKWVDKTKRQAIKHGFVETKFGRKRRLPEAQIENRRDPKRNQALRQAINQPIQGTATDLVMERIACLYQAMTELSLKSRMLLTVHDSLNSSVPYEELQIFIPLAKEILEDFSHLPWVTIPLKVDMEIGIRWGELVEFSEENIFKLAQGEKIENLI